MHLMNNVSLHTKINSLPESLYFEAESYLDFLIQKSKSKKSKKHPKSGCLKGLYVVKKGFDQPLDDFKEPDSAGFD